MDDTKEETNSSIKLYTKGKNCVPNKTLLKVLKMWIFLKT